MHNVVIQRKHFSGEEGEKLNRGNEN